MMAAFRNLFSGLLGAPGERWPPDKPLAPADLTRHGLFVDRAKAGGLNVLFVGDSLIDCFCWPAFGEAVWASHFAPLGAANFGAVAEKTQHVLWRLSNGELEGFSARLVVLLIGTNNIDDDPPAEIVAGVCAIIEEIRARQPAAKVLLLNLLPRGAEPDHPHRSAIAAVNQGLSRLHDGETVHVHDIGEIFLAEDGSIPVGLMSDAIHPTPKGYVLWADALLPEVERLLARP